MDVPKTARWQAAASSDSVAKSRRTPTAFDQLYQGAAQSQWDSNSRLRGVKANRPGSAGAQLSTEKRRPLARTRAALSRRRAPAKLKQAEPKHPLAVSSSHASARRTTTPRH